jgi:hypothetical protein
MKEIEEAKKIYESIEIPPELNSVVLDTIKKSKESKVIPMKKKRYLKETACAAAVLLLGFMTLLNTNEAFAASIQGLPVLGTIAKILTVRSYEKTDEDKTVSVKVPEVQPIETDSEAVDEDKFIADINAKINKIVNNYVTESEARIQEYKEAFIATGGTEEEFTAKNIKVDVQYDIKSETDTTVSFVITANENWSSAYGIQTYYNLDLKNNKNITLKDLLGENYITLVNESIKKQMEERMKADSDITYFGDDMDGFKTINEDTNFYINIKGNPVICFKKYEIAPGFMGIQEFEIIDIDGEQH